MIVVQEIVRGIVWLLVLLTLFLVGMFAFGAWYDEWSGYNSSWRVGDGVCNIAVIPVQGEMLTYPYVDEYGNEIGGTILSDMEYWIRASEQDESIQGMLFTIDSGGGSPYVAQTLANELLRSPLPSAAVIQDMGASAAYWLATGADTIIASDLSTVGSIGVTMSYLERSDQNRQQGLYYVEIASGPYKDTGNPDKYLSDEERELLQRDVDKMHNVFVDAVAANRNLAREEVLALADGSLVLGEDALALGLIDQIGDKETARNWFANELGLSPDDVIFCE